MSFKDMLLEIKRNLGILKEKEEQVINYQQEEKQKHEFEIVVEDICPVTRVKISDFISIV